MGKEKSKDAELRDELLEKGWLHCRIIIEMLGGPKEYVEDTLKQYVDKIKRDPVHKVLHAEFAPVEAREKLWSTFAELDLWVKDASALAFICFDYMPASIEVMEPETFNYRAADFAGFFNDLLARLHKLDMIAKNLRAENQMLQVNGSRILRNNVLISLKEKDKDLATLARNVGISPEQLEPFLDVMITEDYIKKIGDEYTVK